MAAATYRYLPLPTATYRHLPLPTATYRYLPLPTATGAQDGSVCLWNSMSGQRIQTLAGHETAGRGWVMALLLDRPPDDQKGGMLLSASCASPHSRPSSRMHVSSHTFVTRSLTPHTTRPVLPYHTDDHTVGVWVTNGEFSGGPVAGGGWGQQHVLKGHTDGVLTLALSRSRRLAFSGSNDQTVGDSE